MSAFATKIAGGLDFYLTGLKIAGFYLYLQQIFKVFVVIKDKTQNCHIYFERRTEDNYH